MTKLIAIMCISLDGVAEVFDWYLTSGDVAFHTGGSDPMTFKVSGPSAEQFVASLPSCARFLADFRNR